MRRSAARCPGRSGNISELKRPAGGDSQAGPRRRGNRAQGPAGLGHARGVPTTIGLMPTATRLPRANRLAWTIVLTALAGCGGGEVVTAESIARARQTWTKAGIRDYNL